MRSRTWTEEGISLSYLGQASEKIRGNIPSCLSQIKCGAVKLVFINKFSRVGDRFNFKDGQPHHLVNNVIYKVQCSCNYYYIGETGRCLKTRFNEHNKSSGSALTEVGKHLKSNPGHTLDFENRVCVLDRCGSVYKRKIIETLHIQDHKEDQNLLNDMEKSRPLFIFNV